MTKIEGGVFVQGQNFAKGAITLGTAGLLCSLLGSVYRIVLAGMIGTTGIAFYQLAYPVYSLLTVVATAGLPSAISKCVSELAVTGDYRSAHFFFTTCLRSLLWMGLLGSVLLGAGSFWITGLQGVSNAWPAILAIAPCVLFMGVLSVYRGYFQGFQNMRPTATTQIVEEVGKAVVGVGLAFWLLHTGTLYAAVGALAAIPLAEMAAMGYMLWKYNREKPALYKLIRTSPRVRAFPGRKEIRKELFRMSWPVSISAAALALVGLVDNFMVINLLKGSGFSQSVAESAFGLMSGYVSPIVYVPISLSLALQMSLVPNIAASRKLNRWQEVTQTTGIGLKLTTLIGLPCAAGMFLLGPLLLQVIFPGTLQDPDHARMAVQMIQAMAVGLFLLMLSQTTTGILQGMGMYKKPMHHLLYGLVAKAAVGAFLLGIPSLNVLGAAIGTICCMAVFSVMNLGSIFKELHTTFAVYDILIKPLIAMAGMTLPMVGVLMLTRALPLWVGLILGTLVGAMAYMALVIWGKIITTQDLRLLPGGKNLDFWLREKGIWR